MQELLVKNEEKAGIQSGSLSSLKTLIVQTSFVQLQYLCPL